MTDNTHTKFNKSLAGSTLRSVGIRLSVIVLVATAISFWLSWERTQKSTFSTVTEYVAQRAIAEREVFSLAMTQHQIIKKELLRVRALPLDAKASKLFDELVEPRPDGTMRDRVVGFDPNRDVGIFIGPATKIDEQFKNLVVAHKRLLSQFGPAYKNRFANTYLLGPGTLAMLFWPEFSDYMRSAPVDYDFAKEEYGQAGLKVNNPERKSVWTGTYFDKEAKTWMVSLITPIDSESGEHVTNIGHDLLLNQIFDRMNNDVYPGTYNFVYRADGRLIVHPKKMDKLESGVGQYKIQDSSDEYLKSQFETLSHGKVVSGNEDVKILDHAKYSEYLVTINLTSPDWNLVLVFPKALLTASVLKQAAIIFSLGLGTLIVELLLLWVTLNLEIKKPLQTLINSASRVGAGDYSQQIEICRSDELGHLAHVYNDMQKRIAEREDLERLHASELEGLVVERTVELRSQQQAAVQSSRMAALGEMAGGVAHEINNPLAVICGHAEILSAKAAKKEVDCEGLKLASDRINETANRIAEIIRGLQAFARDSKEDPLKDVSLAEIISDIHVLSKSRALKENVEVRFGEISEQLHIACRPAQIGQIILNLMNNSFDAVARTNEAWVSVDVVERGKFCEIRVTDSGSGILPHVAAKIMEPFFTTKAIGKGTGLGLSISLGIARAHGGDLKYEVDSPYTCFVVTVPCKKVKATA